MIFLPEFQVTATSNSKPSFCKTIAINRTDNTYTQTNSGANLVKAVIPADATLQDFCLYSATGSNAGTSATVYIGAVIPFTTIVAAGTTATVTTPVFHNLVTGDVIVVNGTGQANFDKATPVSITVTSTTTFTYTVTSTTATATVGSIACASYFMNPASVLNSTQVAITPGASPYAYTASTYGNLVIQGGTVSSITLTRPGGSAVTLGVTAGMFPVQANDVVTVTYSSAPTMTFIPTDKSSIGYIGTVTKRVGPTAAGWINAATGTQGVPQGTDVQVVGLYQETGTASTSGGTWYVTIWYVR